MSFNLEYTSATSISIVIADLEDLDRSINDEELQSVLDKLGRRAIWLIQNGESCEIEMEEWILQLRELSRLRLTLLRGMLRKAKDRAHRELEILKDVAYRKGDFK